MRQHSIKTPRELNEGYSSKFANYARKSFTNKLIPSPRIEYITHDDLRHTVLKIGDRYYDAEAPDGDVSIQDIPLYKRKRGHFLKHGYDDSHDYCGSFDHFRLW